MLTKDKKCTNIEQREEMIKKINNLLKTADISKIDLILRFVTHLLN